MLPLILLAEDSKFDEELTIYTIRQCGYLNDVLVARDGVEAAELLMQEPSIALLILDLKLPSIDGFEVLKHVRTTPSLTALPVIVLTASAMTSDRNRAEMLGISNFLTKPYDLDDFRTLVAGALAPFQCLLAG